MRKKRKLTVKKAVVLLFSAAAAAAAAVHAGCENGKVSAGGRAAVGIPFGRSYDYGNILVTRVVDGDTLKLENGERVRLIGIDTPETHESSKLYRDARRSGQSPQEIRRMGKAATGFTRGLVEGRRVRLEFDAERLDRYGRLLAYVHLPDGTFVNGEIIRQGYASPMSYPPNTRYTDRFAGLYEEARRNNRGLWKD